MAFDNGVIKETKQTASAEHKSPIQEEAEAIALAHGFPNGNFKFVPNKDKLPTIFPSVDISNGVVKGQYSCVVGNRVMSFNRDDFTPQAWKKICKAVGFKYNDPDDMNKININISGARIDIEVAIKTPEKMD